MGDLDSPFPAPQPTGAPKPGWSPLFTTSASRVYVGLITPRPLRKEILLLLLLLMPPVPLAGAASLSLGFAGGRGTPEPAPPPQPCPGSRRRLPPPCPEAAALGRRLVLPNVLSPRPGYLRCRRSRRLLKLSGRKRPAQASPGSHPGMHTHRRRQNLTRCLLPGKLRVSFPRSPEQPEISLLGDPACTSPEASLPLP